MIYLDQLKSKLRKPWNSGALLLDAFQESSRYPYRVPLLLPDKAQMTAESSSMLKAFSRDLAALEEFCTRFGLDVEWKSKRLFASSQRLPTAAIVPSAEIHARSIGESTTYTAFHRVLNKAVDELPEALEYLKSRWRWTRNNPDSAMKLLASVIWRRDNPDTHCYVRQAQSANVDTKFLESGDAQNRFLELLGIVMPPAWVDAHKDLDWPEIGGFKKRDTKRIRMRFLSKNDSPFPMGITDVEIYEKDLSRELVTRIRNIVVIENNTTVESLPEIPGTLAVYGKGKAVAPVDLSRFETWGKKLFYFGDIDVDGLSCLSMSRASVSFITPLMMDRETFDAFAPDLGIHGANTQGPNTSGLTKEEKELVEYLIEQSESSGINRLEQEKLPFDLVVSLITDLPSPGISDAEDYK